MVLGGLGSYVSLEQKLHYERFVIGPQKIALEWE